jgi:DNA-binding MarR family transcriptional regulator
MGALTTMDKAAFGGWLWAAQRLTKAIEADMPEWMPFEQYDVLVRLELEQDGRLRLSELADSVVISRSGLTRLIDRLEAKGWVERESCPEDRRGAFAVLTAEGRSMREKAWPFLEQAIKTHFKGHMEAGDIEAIVALVQRMTGEEPLLLCKERQGML